MQGVKKKIRDNRWLNWILIISNWVFQGIQNYDKTEKIYRILFTLIFWIISFVILFSYSELHQGSILLISFLIGHTMNWIINGNFYVLIIHRLMLAALSKKELFLFLDNFEKEIVNYKWILYAASFGSICRGKLRNTSDIDISIVRKPGLKNAINAIIFSVKVKKYADLKKIPLEIYISDTPEDSILRFASEKNPVVLFDPENTIDKYYTKKLSLSEAKKLNS